jgi:hypothetical protein
MKKINPYQRPTWAELKSSTDVQPVLVVVLTNAEHCESDKLGFGLPMCEKVRKLEENVLPVLLSADTVQEALAMTKGAEQQDIRMVILSPHVPYRPAVTDDICKRWPRFSNKIREAQQQKDSYCALYVRSCPHGGSCGACTIQYPC